MYFLRACRRRGLIFIGFAISLGIARAQVNQAAQAAAGLGGTLGMVGAASLATDIAGCTYPTYATCAKIPMDIAEIAGGLMAMMNNSQTAAQTSANNSSIGGSQNNSLASMGMSSNSTSSDDNDSSAPSIADQCAAASGICTCTGTTTCSPQLTLPSLDALSSDVAAGYSLDQSGVPNGTSLQSALADLATNYPQAASAVGAFNSASGTLGNGTGTPDSTSNSGVAAAGAAPSHSPSPTLAADSNIGDIGNNDLSLEKLVAKANEERGPQEPAIINGLDLEDPKTGRLLTIFERVTKAIRGEHNRDILLAKVEWTRKEVLKKMQQNVVTAKDGPRKD